MVKFNCQETGLSPGSSQNMILEKKKKKKVYKIKQEKIINNLHVVLDRQPSS